MLFNGRRFVMLSLSKHLLRQIRRFLDFARNDNYKLENVNGPLISVCTLPSALISFTSNLTLFCPHWARRVGVIFHSTCPSAGVTVRASAGVVEVKVSSTARVVGWYILACTVMPASEMGLYWLLVLALLL